MSVTGVTLALWRVGSLVGRRAIHEWRRFAPISLRGPQRSWPSYRFVGNYALVSRIQNLLDLALTYAISLDRDCFDTTA